MKTVFISLVFLVSSLVLQARSDNDTVYAIVNGNQVTINQFNSERNCGYKLSFSRVKVGYCGCPLEKNNTLTWYQVDTAFVYANCICYYDYSIKMDSLSEGNYLVSIYSVTGSGHIPPENVLSDTIFAGSTTFIIVKTLPAKKYKLVSSSAGTCHADYGFKADPSFQDLFEVIIAQNRFTIRSISAALIKRAVLYNLAGQQVYNKSYSEASEINLPSSVVSPGVYVLSLTDSQNNIYTKKVVLF